jgi:3-deoxy-D-manno-octulosonic-acid transferase
MQFFYNLGIYSYGLLIKLISPFNPKAKLWINGRNDFFENLPSISNENIYWFHCASLGEFDQALPVINLIKSTNPSIFVLVTFFSPSGYLHYHKRSHKADFVCYLPLDTTKNAKRFIKHFNPTKAFFVKYEFWANYIFELKKTKAELYSISAIFRPEQRFFKKNNSFFKSILFKFDHFFIQNERSAELLESIGITNYTITGDTRFDRVIENKKNLVKNEILEQFSNDEKTLILGSTWLVDEKLILPIINQESWNQKVIIAPHDISENHISEILKLLQTPYIRYSNLEKGGKYNNEKVLILDTIGHLATAYSYGELAYVGGGFTGNLHNILEPAVFGLPVIFGPKHSRFPEGEMFINEGIGFSISSETEFQEKYFFILKNLADLKSKSEKFIQKQTGASEKIISFLN